MIPAMGGYARNRLQIQQQMNDPIPKRKKKKQNHRAPSRERERKGGRKRKGRKGDRQSPSQPSSQDTSHMATREKKKNRAPSISPGRTAAEQQTRPTADRTPPEPNRTRSPDRPDEPSDRTQPARLHRDVARWDRLLRSSTASMIQERRCLKPDPTDGHPFPFPFPFPFKPPFQTFLYIFPFILFPFRLPFPFCPPSPQPTTRPRLPGYRVLTGQGMHLPGYAPPRVCASQCIASQDRAHSS
jgi:hypothetical protein